MAPRAPREWTAATSQEGWTLRPESWASSLSVSNALALSTFAPGSPLEVEPAFGDAQPCEGSETHGVALCLTAADAARLDAQESTYRRADVRRGGRGGFSSAGFGRRGLAKTRRNTSQNTPRDIAILKAA